MKNKSILSIPECISKGEISYKRGAELIAEDIIRNPENYSVITDDEDILSELSIIFLKRGEEILKKYNSESSTFKTYLYSVLRFSLYTIKRKLYRSGETQILSKAQSSLLYENLTNRYANNEFDRKISNIKPFIHNAQDKKTFKERRSKTITDKNKTPEKSGIQIKDFLSYWTNRTSPKAKTVLILALKSSYYISDDGIDSVCDYCQISKNLMRKTIQELKETLPKKELKLEKLKNQRNNAYARKLAIENLMQDENSPARQIELKKRFEYHSKLWQERTQKIRSNKIKVCPTNKRVAEILGISDRQVGNYIDNAEKIAGEIKKEAEGRTN